jgi:hypothetical protein
VSAAAGRAQRAGVGGADEVVGGGAGRRAGTPGATAKGEREPSLERRRRRRRPHREPPAGAARERAGQAARAVQAGVARAGQRVRAVVDVEQDRVEPAGRHRRADVADRHPHPRIGQRRRGLGADDGAVPLDQHVGDLGDHHRGPGPQRRQRGAQRVAQAEPAEQHPAVADAGAADRRQRLLGADAAVGHQLLAVDADHQVAIAAVQRQLAAAGWANPGQLDPRLHGCRRFARGPGDVTSAMAPIRTPMSRIASGPPSRVGQGRDRPSVRRLARRLLNRCP